MPTITNTKGELVDLATGEVVGRQEGAPAPSTDMRKAGPDQGPSSLWEKAQQLSWGFNSALLHCLICFPAMLAKSLVLMKAKLLNLVAFLTKASKHQRMPLIATRVLSVKGLELQCPLQVFLLGQQLVVLW